MNPSKKVILFFVEGPTDKQALGLIMSKILDTSVVHFEVVHGDLLANSKISNENVSKYMYGFIKDAMNKYRYRKSDIIQVIHIIDTDGAFIPDSCVQYADIRHTEYGKEVIKTSQVDGTIRRHHARKRLAEALAKMDKISGIPYRIFYFSRNMEHVTQDVDRSISSKDKRRYSEYFCDMYEDDVMGFMEFMALSDFSVGGTYEESWKLIMKGTNSLKRLSNFHMCFAAIGL